jgi:hypothetical protein
VTCETGIDRRIDVVDFRSIFRLFRLDGQRTRSVTLVIA